MLLKKLGMEKKELGRNLGRTKGGTKGGTIEENGKKTYGRNWEDPTLCRVN